ncbi:unnamed protein product [Rotaria magnacalcarata]|uniref:CUB domain-containing protein n=1 Tax=Rotaria magnacalcarata TaxID=392030 RepID=A0A816RKW0_9BILA|nr:unnamed protein product [Rotaria magnacalcarata]CAF4066403.1 unnamed protein product [Rotaria magnacalcarata]
MVVWLRPQCILAIVTSLHFCSQLVSSKTYETFWCATEEGHRQASCPDDTALLTDVTIRKVYRRTQSCDPDFHSDYLIHCQEHIDGSSCEGNRTCSIEISSRNYIKCGDKRYPPTYFLVKFTCTQIYTMCADTDPIRNTLYGFIVSPAYPHPMADNVTCSINIEAGPSMYIELAPIQIHLQEASKCRSEYLEIFGYINPLTNNSVSEKRTSNKNAKNIWKSYYTWCGAEQSTNNPLPSARYLISSNSLYIALHTAVSRKPRYFKIRYKVVPSIVRLEYDSDGIAYDSISESQTYSSTTSASIQSITIAMPTVQNKYNKNINGTVPKRTFKKEILIGIIAGVVVLVLAILAGIGIFLFMKKRRLSTGTATVSKSTTSPPANTAGKKNAPGPASSNNAGLKRNAKPIDKTPLLEQPVNTQTTAATAAKRKLVPERTVHIADVNSSRFKSTAGATTTATHTGATGNDTNATNADTVASSSAPSALKQPLTVADSGIYGADLSDDVPPVTKPTSPTEPPKIYGSDLLDKSDLTPPVTVVVNPFSEHCANTTTAATATTIMTNTTSSDDIVPDDLSTETLEEEKKVLLNSFVNEKHLDETVKSAYSHLIDATMSENEGAIDGGSITSSTSPSRRTSNARQPLLSHETNHIETIPRKAATQFNPLHMILKKDANKYYTTEYI